MDTLLLDEGESVFSMSLVDRGELVLEVTLDALLVDEDESVSSINGGDVEGATSTETSITFLPLVDRGEVVLGG